MTAHLKSAHWRKVEPWLARALELEPTERASWLERECSDNELRDELIQLLATVEGPCRDVLDHLRDGILAGANRRGTQVGPFQIVDTLGSGGMGEVYLARRTGVDYEQHVALKLLRSGSFDPEAVERFRHEQRILAALSHPSIAHLIEGGMSDSGTPYIAMEYADGETITRYCDTQGLDIPARLKLFAQVCDVVQFAHNNLVVHRDIKPSNILVGADDTLKLLDFGIAELVDPANTEGERPPTFAARLTPNYAAPEQFHGGNVTTSADVYSLGVLLHELLNGNRPPRAEHHVAPLASNTVGDDSTHCGLSPAALRRRLRGDLDSIVARALQHDPAQRYDGAGELRDDVLRHLNKSAIRARSEDRGYRLGRFVTRHRLGFSAAGAIGGILLFATLFSLHEARMAQASAERLQQAYKRSEAMRGFLLDMLEGAAPGTPARNDSVKALIARGLEHASAEFDQQPELQVELLTALGSVQRRRGDVAGAKSTLRQALDVARTKLGADNPLTLSAATGLGSALRHLGHPEASVAMLQTALASYHAGGEQYDPEEISLLAVLSHAQALAGDADASVATAEQAQALLTRQAPLALDTRADVYGMLGHAYFHARKLKLSMPLLRQALALRRQQHHGPHGNTVAALITLAQSLNKLAKFGEAETLLREAVNMQNQIDRGIPTPRAGALYTTLQSVLTAQGKINKAADAAERALELSRALYASDHPDLATAIGNLGTIRYLQGRPAAAEPLIRESLRMHIATRGETHPYVALLQQILARTVLLLAKYDEAQALLEVSMRADRARYGPQNMRLGYGHTSLAQLAAARGQPGRAAAEARKALRQFDELAPSHPWVLSARFNLIEALLAQHLDAAALEQAQAMVAGAQTGSPVVPATLALAYAELAAAARRTGDTAGAQRALANAEAEIKRIPVLESFHAQRAIARIQRLRTVTIRPTP